MYLTPLIREGSQKREGCTFILVDYFVVEDDLVEWHLNHLIHHTFDRNLHLTVFDLLDLNGHLLGDDLLTLHSIDSILATQNHHPSCFLNPPICPCRCGCVKIHVHSSNICVRASCMSSCCGLERSPVTYLLDINLFQDDAVDNFIHEHRNLLH